MTRPGIGELPELGRAAWHTWGPAGLGRRATYEAVRRSGLATAAEDRWQRRTDRPRSVASVGMVVPGPSAVAADRTPDEPGRIVLYGGLELDVAVPPDWHRHPITGHRYPDDVHWSALTDADPDAGDIKDVWELSRFGWLFPRLRRWSATGDDTIAEEIWAAIEDWYRSNPPYRGVQWMCGQETSIRTVVVLVLADALRDSAATTEERRAMVAAMVFDAVGRVAPTLGYALSQRNNHAISEASFLWSAALLVPDLPGAARLRRRSADALTEAVEDQFAADGSYSQHSPTYQRVAMQLLLWTMAVARSKGVAPPAGVTAAVTRGAGHLRSLLVPGGDGRIPKLGHDDGAHVLPLTSRPTGDFRPLLVHARAAAGAATSLPPGPWDDEAAWFGLEARRSEAPSLVLGSCTRAMTVDGTHVVFRAGPFSHRPAHADQLHVDVWFDGRPVATAPGTFRYTAPLPWANALADEDTQNVPRVSGRPQAERVGRFFWRRWSRAEVTRSEVDEADAVRVARLDLPGGASLVREVRVRAGLVVVVDTLAGAAGGTVRWNLAAPAEIDVEEADGGGTVARSTSWTVAIDHPGVAAVRSGVDDDPTSGWLAPTYAVREPIQVVEVPLAPDRPTITTFTSTR